MRVLARMVDAREDVPLSLGFLSGQENVSVRYLEQIFGKLRAAGIVRGKRGPGGGYVLGMPPEEISLYDVVCVLETEFLPASCLSESRDCFPGVEDAEQPCPLEQSCVTRPLWVRLRDLYYEFMKGHTLSDLAAGRV